MPNVKKTYVRIVILDVDGVVTHPSRFASKLEKDHGVASAAWFAFLEGPYQETLTGKADLKTVIQPFLAEWNWKGTVDEFLTYWFRTEDVVNEEVLKVVEDLGVRGIKCYLASNQDKYQMEFLRDTMNLKHWFDGVFCSAGLGCQKPDKQFFERLLKRIDPKRQLLGQEIIYWDDEDANVKAAKDFKLQASQFLNEEHFVETMSQVTFVSPRFLHKRK